MLLLSVYATIIVQCIHIFINNCYYTFFVYPLHSLYFNGPLLNGYGFWGGTKQEDICAAIFKGTSALFWMEHENDCTTLLISRFNAFLISVQFFIYVVCIYRIVSWCSFRFFILNPTIHRLEKAIFTLQKNIKEDNVCY